MYFKFKSGRELKIGLIPCVIIGCIIGDLIDAAFGREKSGLVINLNKNKNEPMKEVHDAEEE